jgi:hypothetical protein
MRKISKSLSKSSTETKPRAQNLLPLTASLAGSRIGTLSYVPVAAQPNWPTIASVCHFDYFHQHDGFPLAFAQCVVKAGLQAEKPNHRQVRSLPLLSDTQTKRSRMKPRIFAYLAVFAVTLLLIPSASATWSGFRGMGTTPTIGEPSCVQLAVQQVVCVTRSQQSTLMANQFSSNAWSGWTNLAGLVTSDPSCVNDGTGNVVCGVRSGTNTLVARVFNGKKWSTVIDSKGQIFSPPSCAVLRNTKVLCAARSQTSALGNALLNTTTSTWGTFKTVAAMLTSGPGCANDNDGDVICAMNALVTPTNDTIIVNRFDGAKWEGFLTLQGSISGSSPSCTPLGVKGQVVCFDRASNLALYANKFNSGIWQNSNWTGWGYIGAGNIGPRVSCAMSSPGALACGVLYVVDSFMYAATYNGSSWSAFAKVGTKPISGGPACAQLSSGKVTCAVVGLNNQGLSTTGP